MSEYRKKDTIKEFEIDSFERIEINKIKSIINENSKAKKIFRLKPSIGLSALLVIILVTVFSLTLGGNQNQPVTLFNVTQVSANEYMIESANEHKRFYFYYRASIVYENEKIDYNDDFDYNMQYEYVPDNVTNTVSAEFEAFQLNEYRVFLKTNIEGEENIIEIMSFPELIKTKDINGLVLVNFEEDLRDIYDLIEMYPPVFISSTENDIPNYVINPDINEINDLRRIKNYTTYVENFYEHESYYDDLFDGNHEDVVETIFMNDIIVINESNEYIETNTFILLYSGAHITPDKVSDRINYSMSFYSKEEENPLKGNPNWDFTIYDYQVKGKSASFIYNNHRYIYSFVDIEESAIDFSSVTKVKYYYQLHLMYDSNQNLQVIEKDVFIYEGNLVVGPLQLVEEMSEYAVSLFSYFKIGFYDENDNLIYEITVLE